jgi:hypothetical protein
MQLIRHWLEHSELFRLAFLGRGQVQADALETPILEMEHLSSAIREVDDAARNDRSPIIDPDEDHSSIVKVGYAYPAAKGQGWVRCGQLSHLIGLAAGRCPAFKVFSIP